MAAVPWDLFLAAKDKGFSVRERYYLLLVFTSPLVGAYCLHVLKAYFEGGLLLVNFNVPLFLLGAFVRPLMHFLAVIQESRMDVGAPVVLASSDYAPVMGMSPKLAKRVEALEAEVAALRAGAAPIGDAGGAGPKAVEPCIGDRVHGLERRIASLEAQLKKRSATAPRWGYRPKSLVLRMIWFGVELFFWPMATIRRLIFGV